jgi:hypothetical protein
MNKYIKSNSRFRHGGQVRGNNGKRFIDFQTLKKQEEDANNKYEKI